MSHLQVTLRRTLVLGALFASAGCSDIHSAVTGTDGDSHALFAMAQEAVEEAERLYAVADTASAAGEVNRAMLLWAAVDGLQYGSPMHEITVTLDGVPTAFTAILQESALTENLVHHSSARALIAWTSDARKVLVVYDQIDGPGADAALFLDGSDELFLETESAQQVSRSALGTTCVYEQTTPLVGPVGTCLNSTLSADVDVTLRAGTESRTVVVSTGDLSGVQVTRAIENF